MTWSSSGFVLPEFCYRWLGYSTGFDDRECHAGGGEDVLFLSGDVDRPECEDL